jgi:LuxR family maltose regulon positive regulatory protein
VITLTKLEAPSVRPALVRRERLVAAITAAPAKLTLVDAPAGSGKTTLLSEWATAEGEQRPFAWLSLDRSDNDPVRFFDGVVEALQRVVPGIAEEARAALAGPTSLTDVVVPSLINDLHASGRPLVLALDDYHLIDNPRIHEAVAFLLEHMPATLALAIASRTQPPLPLERLRVRREMVEVRAAELRFTEDETSVLLNEMLGLELGAEDVASLQQRTEGWAAGLQLAALSLHGREDAHSFISTFAGDDRPVVDYLGFEVLDALDDAVRRFLLRTSILDRVCAPLCDTVAGVDHGAAMLEALERANLFIVPLDTKRGWYRYHHLFRELLSHELGRTEPALVAELHVRACAWYRDHGHVSEAVGHAIAAGDLRGASELITEHWYDLLQRGRIETVASWLEAVGDEAVRADASLCLTKAWIAVNTGQLDEVEGWIDSAEAAIPDVHGEQRAVLEAGVASLQEIHRYMGGDVGSAVEAGRRSVAGGATPWRPVGCPVLGIALLWSGRAGEAAEELEGSIRAAKSAGNHLAVIHASGGLATIRAEEGDVEAADRVAREALSLADERSLGAHWATTMALVARGRALEQEGRLADAARAIERGAELSRRGVAGVEIAFALLSQAEARQLSGDPDGAAALLAEARRAAGDCPDPGILTELLERTQRRLGARPHKPGKRGHRFADDLTQRELALLRLLPGRMSQREIAESLFVSPNTVKTHLRGIYRKLDAVSREEAVERARELGLL